MAGGVGDRGDPTVVGVAPVVEDDGGDAGGLGTLGDEGADVPAAATLPPVPAERRSASVDEAEASVWPRSSSMTCAEMCLFDR